MRSLRYLNTMLTIIAVLLTMQVYALLVGPGGPEVAPSAQAQGIPDAGAQRKEMIDQLKQLNAKTDQLLSLFKSGQARVKLENPPKE